MENKATVFGIFITAKEGDTVHEVDQVEAVAGLGLKGDRYYTRHINQPEKRVPENELTLAEWESIDLVDKSDEFGPFASSDIRRNIITKNIRLNELVGKKFSIGEMKAEGLSLCEPCSHLEKLTGKKVMRTLVHKAGLRARILSDGLVSKGDIILVEG